MSADDPLPAEARFVIPSDTGELRLALGRAGGELDALLERQGAQTLLCLPLWQPRQRNKRGERRRPSDKRCAKRRERLLQDGWLEGRLELDDADDALPFFYAFDRRRYKGRIRGDDLGLESFFWACRGGALESHLVAPFADDEEFDLHSIRRLSEAGRHDLVRTLSDLPHLRESLTAVGRSFAQLRNVALLVTGIAFVLFLASSVGLIVPTLDEEGSLTIGWKLFALLAHPLVLPPLALGFYLRKNFTTRDDGKRRELSRSEANHAWRANAPHLAAVWGIVLASVLCLSVVRLELYGELSLTELVDRLTLYGMTALWALTPLSYARDRASAIGSCLEAALKVAVTIFVVKLTVFVTRIVTSLMWWALEGFFPLEVPERIKLIVGALAELSAEVALLAVLLGYTWTKAREHFGRWATVAFKDGEGDAEAEVLV